MQAKINGCKSKTSQLTIAREKRETKNVQRKMPANMEVNRSEIFLAAHHFHDKLFFRDRRC